jgi:hypothetical protein
MLSLAKALNTSRGAGKKRLDKRPDEDAHCQATNKAIGITQGNARRTNKWVQA